MDLNFNLLKTINPLWRAYDQLIAKMHLNNCGFVIVDAITNTPIDNEYDLEVIYSMLGV